jgi:predicted P-loop ATPase/GTPase
MATFHIKEDDESPTFQTTLKDNAGTAVNVTGATVVVRMTRIGATSRTIDDASATLDNAAGGVVSYQFSDTDTATHGVYRLNWVVTYSGGRQETFPNEGHDIVQIDKAL